MTMRFSCASVARAAAILAVLACARPSRADDTQACLGSYEQVQRARQDKKLRAAKAQAIACARETCPAAIANECGQWLTEIERGIPTVVVEASTADWRDLVAVRVFVDGEPVAERLDGSALPIDPGGHRFRFETAGAPPIEQQVLVREGEKNRKIAVQFAGGAPGSGAAPVPDRPVPVAAFVLAGVGVLGAAGFATFGLLGTSKRHELDACKPHCASADVGTMMHEFAVADVSLAVGIVSLGAATWIYLTRPAVSKRGKGSLGIVPLVCTRGGWVDLIGSF